MGDFHTRPFAQRFDALGDQAEAAFLSLNPKAHRTGLNRPLFSMARMATNLRYTPDYLLADGFYEVQGFSSRTKAGSLKTKLEKADALRTWGEVGDTFLWVYDSYKNEFWCAPIADWYNAFIQKASLAEFPDNGREYWDLKPSDFPCAPTPIEVTGAT